MKILVLDPGEKVGWATAQMTSDGLAVLDHGISHLKDTAMAVYDAVVERKTYSVVVCETWRLRPGSAKHFIGNDFPSVQFIGMVRLCCWLANVKYVGQSPSVKSTANQLLTAAHYPEIAELIAKAPAAHDQSHDTDALRHLVAYHWGRQ